ncbi:hypothetical protein NEDG_00418 [Nematocida displodere]|uniref:CS domain-containing protein n=1 Tax=Nematocida displodere TaxID=1805483 RepID=A0A177EIZ5_9MICR|nr:hypothetical protein NEDG_00418 [Nematocida displodere]
MQRQCMEWTQTLNEAVLTIATLDGTPKGLKVKLSKGWLDVSQHGETILLREIEEKMKEDEMYWSAEDSSIEIVLVKDTLGWWSKVFVGDTEIDTSQIEPESLKNFSSFDKETQLKIERMLAQPK